MSGLCLPPRPTKQQILQTLERGPQARQPKKTNFHNYTFLSSPSRLIYCWHFLFHRDNKSNQKRLSHTPIVTTNLPHRYPPTLSFLLVQCLSSPILCPHLNPIFSFVPWVQATILLQLSFLFSQANKQQTIILKTNNIPLTSHHLYSYYSMCQGNRSARSDMGITGIRLHTIGRGPEEVKVQ